MSDEPVPLSERPKHFTLKLIAFFASLALLIVAIVLGVMGYLHYDSGYYQLTAAASDLSAYGGDMTALVYFEGSSASLRGQVSTANALYSKALESAYMRTDAEKSYTSSASIGRVNLNPNVPTALDQETYALLHDAYEKDLLYSNFSLYAAPLYDYWANLASFPSTSQQTEDPINNAVSANYLASLLAHVQSAASHCSLLFDEEATSVTLKVDDTYLAFRKDNEITSPILSLNILRDAYKSALLSKALINAGYTKALLSTPDGTMMSLGGVETTEYRLYDHDGTKSIYYGVLRNSGESCGIETRRFENDSTRVASPYFTVKDSAGALHYRSPWLNLQTGYPTDYLVEMAYRKKDLDVVSAMSLMNEFQSAIDETQLSGLKAAYLKSGALLSYNKKGETKKVYVNQDEKASLILVKAEGYEAITY
jgi:hypothetical protein